MYASLNQDRSVQRGAVSSLVSSDRLDGRCLRSGCDCSVGLPLQGETVLGCWAHGWLASATREDDGFAGYGAACAAPMVALHVGGTADRMRAIAQQLQIVVLDVLAALAGWLGSHAA